MLTTQNLIPPDYPNAQARAALRVAALFDYDKSDMTGRNNGAASLLLSSGNVSLGVFCDDARALAKGDLGVVMVGGRAMKISMGEDLQGHMTECESGYATRIQSEYGVTAGVMLLVKPDLVKIGQNPLQKQALMGAMNEIVAKYVPGVIKEDLLRYNGGFGSSTGAGQTLGHKVNSGISAHQFA